MECNATSKPKTHAPVGPSLIRRAQSGDAAASEKLMTSLYPFLKNVVKKFVGTRDPSSVDDITQDAAASIVCNLHTFLPERAERLHGWAATIARNQCRDAFKRTQRSWATLESSEKAVDPASSHPTPLTELMNKDEIQKIKQAVNRLPEKLRRTFILREYAGLSYHEVARQTETIVATAKTRLSRARQSLRSCLT